MIYSTGATCSGNGIAQSTSSCGAACRCLGGWRGPLCDRTTAGGRGDPHLETLDGVQGAKKVNFTASPSGKL